MINGATDSANGKLVNQRTRCSTDTFGVSSAPNIPLVCGTLTGDHGLLILIILRSERVLRRFNLVLGGCKGCNGFLRGPMGYKGVRRGSKEA